MAGSTQPHISLDDRVLNGRLPAIGREFGRSHSSEVVSGHGLGALFFEAPLNLPSQLSFNPGEQLPGSLEWGYIDTDAMEDLSLLYNLVASENPSSSYLGGERMHLV